MWLHLIYWLLFIVMVPYDIQVLTHIDHMTSSIALSTASLFLCSPVEVFHYVSLDGLKSDFSGCRSSSHRNLSLNSIKHPDPDRITEQFCSSSQAGGPRGNCPNVEEHRHPQDQIRERRDHIHRENVFLRDYWRSSYSAGPEQVIGWQSATSESLPLLCQNILDRQERAGNPHKHCSGWVKMSKGFHTVDGENPFVLEGHPENQTSPLVCCVKGLWTSSPPPQKVQCHLK